MKLMQFLQTLNIKQGNFLLVPGVICSSIFMYFEQLAHVSYKSNVNDSNRSFAVCLSSLHHHCSFSEDNISSVTFTELLARLLITNNVYRPRPGFILASRPSMRLTPS